MRQLLTHPPAPSLHRPLPARQHGAALLVAMILVTVVSTLAAGLVWRQWRAVEVEAAERSRAQSAWILNGALDWAKLILREDGRTSKFDHLGEPWAVPLAEARLSTFLAAERSANADDGPEAFLSGDITDAQSRYNLRNLIDTNTGKPDPKQVSVLQQLMTAASLQPTLAQQLANSLAQAWAASPAADAPLAPRGVDDLVWLGLDEAAISKLAPWVTILPAQTQLNINTAPVEVLAAVVLNLGPGGAQRVVQQRERQPFVTVAAANALFGSGGGPLAPDFNTCCTTLSEYFEVHGRLRLGDQIQEERSLVNRQNGANVVTTVRRQRLNTTLATPAGATGTTPAGR